MNRGKRASGRVRNSQCAVLRDHAGQYEQALGLAIQRANRRGCAVSVACGHGPGVSEWRPGVNCSDGDGQNSSADNPEEPPLRALRHALFAEWLINRHQHARSIRALVLAHNVAPPARHLHRYCAQRHAHDTSGTINCVLRLNPSMPAGP